MERKKWGGGGKTKKGEKMRYKKETIKRGNKIIKNKI